MERSAREGDSPVIEKEETLVGDLEYHGTSTTVGSRADHCPRLNTFDDR